MTLAVNALGTRDQSFSVGVRLALLDGIEQVHGDISDHDFVFFDTFALDAIVDHDVAEWAGGRDALGAGCEQLL